MTQKTYLSVIAVYLIGVLLIILLAKVAPICKIRQHPAQ